jgi:hypothetical protein
MFSETVSVVIFSALFCTLGLSIVAISVADIWHSTKTEEGKSFPIEMLRCFALRRNVGNLMRTNSYAGEDYFGCLNGMRLG